jgi:hypothetical protein
MWYCWIGFLLFRHTVHTVALYEFRISEKYNRRSSSFGGESVLPDSADLEKVLLGTVGPNHVRGAGVVYTGGLREQARACQHQSSWRILVICSKLTVSPLVVTRVVGL